ncbi:MAG: hypothetical protein QGG17_02455 [Rhodospirillales bacterium]|nr:hypothetical protein [Rhodospirillales bacterium]MDP6804446.1 hypothetical protein [Rhodospirillales bacterium]
MIRAILAAVAAVLVATPSFAQETNELKLRALDNFSHEATECAAFYLISSGAHHNAYDSASAERTKKMSDALLLRAARVNASDTVLANFMVSADEQQRMMDNDYDNFQVVVDRYEDRCQVVLDDYEGRLEYWMDQALRGLDP